MNTLSHKIHKAPMPQSKILQFGEGNFLRAFFDFAIQQMNQQGLTNYGVTVVNSLPISNIDLNKQDCLYTVVESSAECQKSTVVDCIQEHFGIEEEFEKFLATATNLGINIIVSNTTEAGITYIEESKEHPKSFPARLTLWLCTRFNVLKQKGSNDKVFILPCELIENNGTTLKSYILQHANNWGASTECIQWIESCYFYNTLVDRIVPGYPHNFINDFQQQWEYTDQYAVLTEEFFLFVIQGHTKELDQILPLSKLNLNIIYTDDLVFYRNRKVAVLNGAHTLLVSISILLGDNSVANSLSDPLLLEFLTKYLYNDVFEVLKGDDSTKKYIDSIFSRFQNPFLEHKWQSISLNSLAKFNTRNMPILLGLESKNSSYGLFALAALWYYYSQAERNDTDYALFYKISSHSLSTKELIHNLLNDKTLYPFEIPSHWEDTLIRYYTHIAKDTKQALQALLKGEL